MFKPKNVISIARRLFSRKKLIINLDDDSIIKDFEQEFGIEPVKHDSNNKTLLNSNKFFYKSINYLKPSFSQKYNSQRN